MCNYSLSNIHQGKGPLYTATDTREIMALSLQNKHTEHMTQHSSTIKHTGHGSRSTEDRQLNWFITDKKALIRRRELSKDHFRQRRWLETGLYIRARGISYRTNSLRTGDARS